ncbi:MAG: hypothetical protein IPP72_15785 [Chitinophagaceae bacterium]|nr:hypothetical protein [Chitinophagaceae bacterium]
MPYPELNQLQYESDTWKRSLDCMMDENIQLKERMSEILKNDFDKTHLEGIENFQNSFIKQDALIGLLRNEMTEVENLLKTGTPATVTAIGTIHKKLDNLRSNISYAEKYMQELKFSFDNYILKLPVFESSIRQ